jgi:hypothetical protein
VQIWANLSRPCLYCSPASANSGVDSAIHELIFDRSKHPLGRQHTDDLLQTSTTMRCSCLTVCVQGMPPSQRTATVELFVFKIAMCSFTRKFLIWLFKLRWWIGPLWKIGHCPDFGFAREQEAEARWLHFWSAKLAEGEDRRAQQVNVGLLCGQSHFPLKLFWLYLEWESNCWST